MASQGSWTSPYERIPNAVQVDWIDELRSRDRSIGDDSHLRWGNSANSRTDFFARVWRRLSFESRKRIGIPATRFFHNIDGLFFRFLGSRRTIAAGIHAISDETDLYVVDATDVDFDLGKLLEETTSTHIVFIRGSHSLLKSGLSALVSVAKSDNEKHLWFGDSRNAQGQVVRRPPFSLLLLRQVDYLGPVVMVTRSHLESWNDLNTVPRELLLLALGLDTLPSEVALVQTPLGVGNMVEVPSPAHAPIAIDLVKTNLYRNGVRAEVTVRVSGVRNVIYDVNSMPLVSIVIPTRGSGAIPESYVERVVESICEKSSYFNFEIVIVADDPTPSTVVNSLDSKFPGRIAWVRWSDSFDFSRKMNLGAAMSLGDYLLFLNDDVEVVAPDWIERMLSLIGIEDIAYTGGLLYFEDASIQHAGHLYTRGARHIGFGEVLNERNPEVLLNADRIVSGVTAACGLMSKALFEQVGGFSEAFPGNYNDVDLSLKVLTSGRELAVAAGAKLYHFESKTRDSKVLRREVVALEQRWSKKLIQDAFWRES